MKINFLLILLFMVSILSSCTIFADEIDMTIDPETSQTTGDDKEEKPSADNKQYWIKLNKDSLYLTPNTSAPIIATVSETATIFWTIRDTSIARLSANQTQSGLMQNITGISAGSTTLEAKTYIGGATYKATCDIIVTSSGGSENSIKITSYNFDEYFEVKVMLTAATTKYSTIYAYASLKSGFKIKEACTFTIYCSWSAFYQLPNSYGNVSEYKCEKNLIITVLPTNMLGKAEITIHYPSNVTTYYHQTSGVNKRLILVSGTVIRSKI